MIRYCITALLPASILFFRIPCEQFQLSSMVCPMPMLRFFKYGQLVKCENFIFFCIIFLNLPFWEKAELAGNSCPVHLSSPCYVLLFSSMESIELFIEECYWLEDCSLSFIVQCPWRQRKAHVKQKSSA